MNTATIIGLVITGLSALAGIIIGVVKLIKSNNASETEHNNSNAAYGMVGGTQGMSHSQIYAAAHQQPTPQPIPVQPVVRPTIVPQRPVVMPGSFYHSLHDQLGKSMSWSLLSIHWQAFAACSQIRLLSGRCLACFAFLLPPTYFAASIPRWYR